MFVGCHQRRGRVCRRVRQLRIGTATAGERDFVVFVARGKTGDQAAGTRADQTTFAATFAYRVGQRHQIVVVGIGRLGGQRRGVADEFPTARRGDAARMFYAQIPGVGFPHGSEWPDDRRGVRVNERQRSYCIVRTPGPAAATGYVHERKAIALNRW